MKQSDLTAAADWLTGDNTGTSSKTLLATAMAKDTPQGNRFSYPRDAPDFERCLRLLRMAPGIREAAFPVLAQLDGWAPLIAHWDELASIWDSSPTYEPLTSRMREVSEKKAV